MITAKTIREALKCENPSCACHSSTGNVHCPAHADSNPSLKLKEKDGNILLKCFGGCSQDRVIAALKEKGLWPSGNGGSHQARKKPLGEPVAVYDYHDAEGQL